MANKTFINFHIKRKKEADLGRFEFDDISGKIGVAIIRRLPAQLDSSSGLFQHFEVVRRLRLLLHDEVDGGVVRAEGVGGHTREESGVLALSSFDADGTDHTAIGGLLADGISLRHFY